MADVVGSPDKKEIERQLKGMMEEFRQRGGGICLQEVAGGFQFRTRGDLGPWIKKLLEKKMVRIMGRKDVPGKPMIYGTTKKFLEVFGLKDLSELPTLQELKELKD